MTRKLKIDTELRDLLPPLTKEEREGLKASIEKEGCQDSIKVWKGKSIIVDGHNRYAICCELGAGFQVKELPFADKAEVAEWMVTHQDARRNMTPAAISAARGLAYNMRKRKHGGGKEDRDKEASAQCEHLPQNHEKTADTVAEETGSSSATVRRDAKFQEALSKLSEGVRKSILAGDVRKPNVQALKRLDEYDAKSQAQIIKSVKDGEHKTVKAALDAVEEDQPVDPEAQAKHTRKLAMDYIVKAVNTVDNYADLKPNKSRHAGTIKLLQQAGRNLW